MEPPTVTDASWEKLPEPIDDLDWTIRVELTGTGLIDRALPMVAAVGDVPVEGLSGSMLGDSAQGFLSATPAVGARLIIGFADTGCFETEVAFPGFPDA